MSDKLEIKFDMSDIKRVTKLLTRISVKAREKALDGMEEFAQDVLLESSDLVPVDTGTLRASTFIDKYEESITFGYGGSNDLVNPKTGQYASEYMDIVHEDLEMRHPNGGQAKFFEIPLLAKMGELNDYIRRAIFTFWR